MASSAAVRGQEHHRRELRHHLDNKPCPNCNSDRTSGVEGDPLIRCCAACQNVFGFDDSTAEVELFQEIEHGRGEERPGNCGYEDGGYDGRSGSKNSRHESRDDDDDDGRWDGRNGGGCGSAGGNSNSGRPGSGGRGECRGCCQNGGSSGRHGNQNGGENGALTSLARSASVEAAIGCGMRVAGSMLGSLGSPPDQLVGNVVRATTNEMEPIGQQVGAMVGAFAGSIIGSPRGAELGGNMGATVGRGVAEMVRDSSLYPNGGGATGRGQREYPE